MTDAPGFWTVTPGNRENALREWVEATPEPRLRSSLTLLCIYLGDLSRTGTPLAARYARQVIDDFEALVGLQEVDPNV